MPFALNSIYVFLRKKEAHVRLGLTHGYFLFFLFFSHDKQETDEVVQLQEGETRV